MAQICNVEMNTGNFFCDIYNNNNFMEFEKKAFIKQPLILQK